MHCSSIGSQGTGQVLLVGVLAKVSGKQTLHSSNRYRILDVSGGKVPSKGARALYNPGQLKRPLIARAQQVGDVISGMG